VTLDAWLPLPAAPEQVPPFPTSDAQESGSLPRLRDAAVALPFAGSTSNKAVHGSQRHGHTVTDNTDTASHRDCYRQGTAFNITYIQDSHTL